MAAKNEQERLDMLLTRRGYFPTREKAKAAVMAGQVKVNGSKIDKPGKSVDCSAEIEVAGRNRYVSRGGLKLEKALVTFGINLQGRIVLDVGASTGGFTDCALQNGARKVYAVDVGYGQLDWKLRSDPRVKVMERTNIRYLEKERLDELPDFITIDVSFISLALVLPRLMELSTKDACCLALIKPQFEAGREKVGSKGVVRDPAVHRDTMHRVCTSASNSGWCVLGLDFSPVKGPEGNIEYLIYMSREAAGIECITHHLDNTVNRVVKAAHLGLN